MKRFLSISLSALLLTAALGSCQSHTSYDNSAGASTAGTSTAPTSGPETSAQQEEMAPRVDAPNNAGMPADSSTSQ